METVMWGIIIGALVGGVLAIVIMKVLKKDKSMKCKWDERQLLARGNGFKYGFFTMIILLVIYGFSSVLIKKYPIDASAVSILIVCVAVTVYVVYCIWQEAYIALNENQNRLMVVFIVIGGVNLMLGIMALVGGDAFTDGVLNIRSSNLFCGGMILIAFVTILLKKHVSSKELEEE